MGKINWGRVVLGGLLFGVVYSVLALGLVTLFVGREKLLAPFQALGPLPRPPIHPATFLVGMYILGGILIIWWYAAIRPRYGPGPKTAAITGFAVWLIAVPAQTFILGYLVQFPTGLMVRLAAINLVCVIVSTLVGAWPYKED